MSEQVTATTYLIIEAQRRPSWTVRAGELPTVCGMKVVAIRQGRPTKLTRDQIAVRVTVGTDPAVFSPITADLAVDIDPANLIRPVVTDVAPEPAPEVS
ncbi:hypothetical protein ACXYTP_19160 [Tsukamurella ocularis]|uniref:hypothetical protein n=1 Tax=Tsukamurella ocularis TaxID=1970234 RepID=UPI0039EDED95